MVMMLFLWVKGWDFFILFFGEQGKFIKDEDTKFSDQPSPSFSPLNTHEGIDEIRSIGMSPQE